MSSTWNNRLPGIIAPFWCEKGTVLHPDLPKEQNPTPARHLNSRFLVLFLSLVLNITYKGSATWRIPPYCRPPTPSRLCLRKRGLAPPQVFPRIRGEYGTSEKRESWRPAGSASEGMMGKRAERKRGVMRKEKRESFIFSPLPITPFAPFH